MGEHWFQQTIFKNLKGFEKLHDQHCHKYIYIIIVKKIYSLQKKHACLWKDFEIHCEKVIGDQKC